MSCPSKLTNQNIGSQSVRASKSGSLRRFAREGRLMVFEKNRDAGASERCPCLRLHLLRQVYVSAVLPRFRERSRTAFGSKLRMTLVQMKVETSRRTTKPEVALNLSGTSHALRHAQSVPQHEVPRQYQPIIPASRTQLNRATM